MWSLKQDFDAASVDAQIVTPHYWNPFEDEGMGMPQEAQRTRLVIDSYGKDVGHVTERYALVRNPELRGAVEVIGERHGLDLKGWKSQYSNGRTCLVWRDDTNPVRVKGDSSVLWPMVKITNDYRGMQTLKGDLVVCRHICENALIWGEVFGVKLDAKHTGQIDLMELLDQPLQALGDHVEVMRLQMEVLAEYALKGAHPVWGAIKEDTPERYHEPLGRAIRENWRELGVTAYAALQAVAEVGSHNMRGWAAADWTQRQSQRIIDAMVQEHGALVR